MTADLGHAGAVTMSNNSVRDLLIVGESLFTNSAVYFGHGTDNAWDEAVCLLSFALSLGPEVDRSELDRQLSVAENELIKALYQQRIDQRIPAPYLTGQAWFCGLPFTVDQRVIIPRSPIAQLIMCYFQPWLTTEPSRILDLCAGSGCIGISCAYGFEDATVVLSDISTDALAVAEINVHRHKMLDRVTVIQSDLFCALTEQCFDLIVCNPPYVDAADLSEMPDEYKHEPPIALASGNDGLDFTRQLLQQAADYLTSEGILIVEVGNSCVALEAAFPRVPFLWLDFEQGDGGVFLITRDELVAHREFFT
ncbi:MAG TPA: 50S ribosomal protein L3 N(5)-glutamine methyltransferase [Porticoccaceae bacterium]|jgi:ribosomal protein L3 glutamine methyltransferase|nr:50S ribosomal protein L3 N(5)-glutamine methyltransferase [Porticoccaceae bacterium]